MSVQYDDIGSKYSAVKALPIVAIEDFHLHDILTRLLGKRQSPVRVLELASGMGHYSRKIIDWGAASVLGIDISKGMVDAAVASTPKTPEYEGKLKFLVKDVRELGRVDENGERVNGDGREENGDGRFDIVLAVWCLNYAESKDDMVKYWETIAVNLKKDGVFVGLTPPHVEELDVHAEKRNRLEREHPGVFGLRVNYVQRLESGEGYKCHLTGPAGIEFENYHLKQSLYEQAAREGGIKGKLEWKEIYIPEEVRKGSKELWLDLYAQHIGIVIAEKY